MSKWRRVCAALASRSPFSSSSVIAGAFYYALFAVMRRVLRRGQASTLCSGGWFHSGVRRPHRSRLGLSSDRMACRSGKFDLFIELSARAAEFMLSIRDGHRQRVVKNCSKVFLSGCSYLASPLGQKISLAIRSSPSHDDASVLQLGPHEQTFLDVPGAHAPGQRRPTRVRSVA
jgi:hypothetical protein